MADERLANVLGAFALAVSDELEAATAQAAGHAGAGPAALVALSDLLAGRSVDDLRRAVGLTHSGGVRVVDRLVGDGLAERRPGPDGRSVAFALTPAGRRLAGTVRDARQAALQRVLDVLDDERAGRPCPPSWTSWWPASSAGGWWPGPPAPPCRAAGCAACATPWPASDRRAAARRPAPPQQPGARLADAILSGRHDVMPDTYSLRRSRFPAPAPAEIFAGPLLTDATGSLVMTDQFLASRDGPGALVPGRFAFERDGVVVPAGEADATRGVGRADRLAGDGQQSICRPSSSWPPSPSAPTPGVQPLHRRGLSRRPPAFLLPFLDVVEVSTVKVAQIAYSTVVTCEDIDGGRRTFRFQSAGETGSRKKSELLAWAIVCQRINRDFDAAEEAVAQQGLAPYLAEARELAGGGPGEGVDDGGLVLAQARQLRRRALKDRGTTVVAETRAAMKELLADVLPGYRRIREIEGMLTPERLALLP